MQVLKYPFQVAVLVSECRGMKLFLYKENVGNLTCKTWPGSVVLVVRETLYRLQIIQTTQDAPSVFGVCNSSYSRRKTFLTADTNDSHSSSQQ